MRSASRLALLVALAVLPCLPATAAEDGYPAKPVRLVVPFGPGGGGDTVGRILAQKLSTTMGTTVVENRPGAGATVGTDFVAKAPPDGYTILLANVGPMTIAPSLYSKLPYDPVRDFVPISRVAVYPNVLVVNPSVPARSVKELVALAKARPNDLTFASAGNGSSTHLSGELLKASAGIKMVHVPYKNSAQAVTDLITGQVHLYFSSTVGALPHVKTGKLRALGVTSARRSRIVPELPTIAESGYPGFEADNWLGIVTPRGTPQAIVARLYKSISSAVRQPDVEERLAKAGAEVIVDSPEQFAAYIAKEMDKWARVVKASGARVD